MNRLSGRIFLGNREDASIESLNRERIHAVACLCETDLDVHLDGVAPRLHIAQYDIRPIKAADLRRFLEFMRFHVMESRHRVLVHCFAGKSRTPVFACAWLMNCGFSWDDAEAIVALRNPFPHGAGYPALKESVLKYFTAAD